MLKGSNGTKSYHMIIHLNLNLFKRSVSFSSCLWSKLQVDTWQIVKATGQVSYVYIVKLPNGTTWRHHQDQLKSCRDQVTTPSEQLPDTVSSELLTAPSVSISRKRTCLQTAPTSVPHRYPQRT